MENIPYPDLVLDLWAEDNAATEAADSCKGTATSLGSCLATFGSLASAC